MTVFQINVGDIITHKELERSFYVAGFRRGQIVVFGEDDFETSFSPQKVFSEFEIEVDKDVIMGCYHELGLLDDAFIV